MLNEAPDWPGDAPLGGRKGRGDRRRGRGDYGSREGGSEGKKDKIKFSVPLVLID